MMEKTLRDRFNGTVDAIYNLNPPIPDKMLIEVTNMCNHSCIFCPNSKIDRKRTVIDETLLFNVLSQAYELGLREVGLHTTGEPFTCDNYASMIKMAKHIGYTYVYTTTNGALATPERQIEVFEAGLNSIKFSINAGSKETYLEIHGKDDFNKVFSHLKFCSEYRKKSGKKYKIYVSCVVTNLIQNEIEYIKSECLKYADDIVFIKLRSYGGLMPENTDLDKCLTTFDQCALPFNTIHITCEGYLSPCSVDLHYKLILGDLNHESLKDAWSGDRITELRRKLIDNDLDGIQCRECLRGGGARAEVLNI
jgi:radical SAM protein with 4Fe4S-binding SPASM domain